MDIAAEVQEFRDAIPLQGLDDAWTWTIPGGAVRLALALSPDKKYAFQLNCRKGYSTELAVSVLGAARANSARLSAANPFATAAPFRFPSNGFDCLISMLPSVARLHRTGLGDVAYAVFPGWHCEVSGDETENEAITRYKRMIRPWDYTRTAQPFLRMRYENPRSGVT